MSGNATYADVEAAARRIADHAHRTPVLTSTLINQLVGAEVFFKCENFQRVGAFKFRGAFNALSQFSTEQRHRGVVSFSSGNHAQGISLAARILGIPATIVMPQNAPRSKLAATRGYGAEVITYDPSAANREDIAGTLAAERGLTLIPSYDHPHIIAGQGTAAKELFEEVGQLDALFVPLGGGGLLGGSILAAEALVPACELYGVEPEASNDAQQSLRTGAVVHIDAPVTIADGAATTHLGYHNFEIIRYGVTDILTVSDAALVDVLKLFCSYMKVVVEPTGCLGMAALWASPHLAKGRRVGVIISGGNVDLARLGSLLAANTAQY